MTAVVAYPVLRFRGVEISTLSGISWSADVGPYRVLVQFRLDEVVLEDRIQRLVETCLGQVDLLDGVRVALVMGPNPQRVADDLSAAVDRYERDPAGGRSASHG